MLKVIDLFSGVGGISFGFQEEGFEVILANEIDPEISQAYKKNHPTVNMINADITQLEISTIFKSYKYVDVVTGGPPCQGFSQKGARNIMEDDRNFLFKYFYEVVKFVQPKYFVMENVPNLLTSQNGYFREQIIQLFTDLGYSLDYGVLNAYDFGVPQIRKRAVIIGKQGNNPVRLPTSIGKKVSIEDAIWDLAYLESGEGEEVQEYRLPPTSDYQRHMRRKSDLLFNHVSTKHSRLALERLRMIPIGKGKEVLPEEHLTKSIYSGTWCRMIRDEPSVTITTRFDTPSSGRFTHPFLNRAITVREAARIQSFPDHFIFYGTKSSQMKQVGNAVPPLLAQSIARQIKLDAGSRISTMNLLQV